MCGNIPRLKPCKRIGAGGDCAHGCRPPLLIANMEKRTPKQPASEKANPSPSEPVGTGKINLERLREICKRQAENFTRALSDCDSGLLARGDVAAGLVNVVNAGAAFDDVGIDEGLRKLAREEGIWNAGNQGVILRWMFGEDEDTINEMLENPQELNEEKARFILERETEDLRRAVSEWVSCAGVEGLGGIAGDDIITLEQLRKVAFVAQAESRRMNKSHAAQPVGAGAVNVTAAADGKPSGGESETPARVAGDWATAQGVKNYNGECFSFKGLCLERKPKRAKQWADIAAVIESTEPDGAAMLGKNWRGKFSNADDEYKSFTRFIHPLPERGAGWFRLEKEKIAERRKW